MEFEHDTPATAKDIALADAPKVTLQPYHDVQVDSVVADRSHRNEGSFEFETESTDAAALSAQTSNLSHHHTALVAAIGTVVVFGAILLVLFMAR
jgi:hypothetical protein